MLALFAIQFFLTPDPKAPFYVSTVASAFCLFLALVHTPIVVGNWYPERLELTEAEHVSILVVLAVYGSIAYGALNFLIYRIDPTAFLMDRQFAEEFKNRELTELNDKLEKSKANSQACDEAIGLISALPQDFVGSQSTSPSDWNTTWNIQTTLPELRIQVTRGTRAIGSTAEIYSIVRVSFNGVSFVSDSFMKPDDDSIEEIVTDGGGNTTVIPSDRSRSIFLQLEGNPVSKEAIINFLAWRARWEKDEWSPYLKDQLAKVNGNRSITPGLFLYQGIMETFNMSPGYFKPSRWITRMVAVLYAITKYVYFAILIAIVIKKLNVLPRQSR